MNRFEVGARLKLLTPGYPRHGQQWRVICGRERCPSRLGEATWSEREERWWLRWTGRTGWGYWRDADGTYSVIVRSRRSGLADPTDAAIRGAFARRSRRPMRRETYDERAGGDPRVVDYDRWHLLGMTREPVGDEDVYLPSAVRCPVCGAYNRVAPPD